MARNPGQPETKSPAAPSPETSRILIEVQGITVHYGSVRALHEVDLFIPRHQITAIVGPSGCGKSTFLSCLNRLSDLEPSCSVTGSIRLEDRDVLDPACDVLDLRRRVGMVFQKPNPFPLTIRRNLALPLQENGVRGAEVDDRIEATLQDVGLWREVYDRLDRPALSLSGGQQQRLCIARALALRPEAILFDEPCSALDPISSGVVEDLIVSLREKITVVIVTHNLAQARRIADQLAVFWLREGSGAVIETGEAKKLFEGAVDPDAAAYLAGMRG